MKQFNLYFNQICNICIWLNNNTKVDANVIYDGKDGLFHIDISENNDAIYAHEIEGLNVKSEERINLEMKRLVEYLLNIKQEKENGSN